jgi:transcriptional regulator GlxA family with amidase domain
MATIGIVLFDGVEELDFVGPWEVFKAAAELKPGHDSVVLLAEEQRIYTCAKGLRVLPDEEFRSAPRLDVLVVPGGRGVRREVHKASVMHWLREKSAECTWVTSVCTGTLLLHEAGPAQGRRVTTHASFVETLRARGNVTVVEGPRYVRDGSLVTAAGVSAGIDMALWLVGQMHTPAFAREVQKYMEYTPEPPYSE